MADELTFKLKIMKSLYGMGMKGMGDTLLTELRRGGPEWMGFVQALIEGEDYPRRKTALKQLTTKGVIEKSKQKAQLLNMLLEFLSSKKAISEEKKAALKFVEQNLGLFPADDDGFRGKILQLQRETDVALSSAASALLPKLGINMDDRELYRRN